MIKSVYGLNVLYMPRTTEKMSTIFLIVLSSDSDIFKLELPIHNYIYYIY